ncbi:MAG TPA: helix-turn-helix domain-containing protein [Chloroflexota bacterium]
MERQTISVQEAARLLGIGRTSAYLAVRRGDLPVLRIGRRYVVPRVALERLLGQAAGDALPNRPTT